MARKKQNILCLGPIDSISITRELNNLLRQKSFAAIYLVDGGFLHFKKLNAKLQKKYLPKTFWVGDGDSLRECHSLVKALFKHFPDKQKFFHSPIKDASDTKLMLKLLQKNWMQSNGSPPDIYAYGFLNSGAATTTPIKEQRLDHLLCNVGEFHRFSKRNKSTLFLDRKAIILPAGKHQFKIEGLFSLIFFQKSRVKLMGQCDYTLPEGAIIQPFSSHMLSNIGRGKVSLDIQKTALLTFS